ncbi:MAG: NAD-dependent epimerase/dehydratase family protein [Solirubrobacterales bacterium]
MSDIILITGGLGYLGGRIARWLSENTAYSIRIADLAVRAKTPDWLRGEIVQADLTSEDDMRRVCQDVRHVVHLAALNEIDSAREPDRALLVNTLAAARLVRCASEAGAEKFLYFSTAHVYGAPLTGTIAETTLPRPVHPYAMTHYAAEQYVLAARDLGQIEGIVVRLSNGIGAPADPAVSRWTLVGNDLCRQAVTNRELILKSSGMQQRDFITLEDTARGVEHLLTIPREAAQDGLFNLGGACSFSIYEVTQRIAARCKAVLGFEPPISRQPPGPNEQSQLLDYRIDKLQATGFELTGDLDQEIDDTIRLCQSAFTQY